MTRLPEPIGRALSNELDEERFHSLWHGTQDRITRRARPTWPIVAGAVLLALSLAGVAATIAWDPVAPERAPISLALADGSAPVAVESNQSRARVVVFADRSSITLASDSRVSPLANDAHHFTIALERGAAEVEVTPGGPRRWRVESGPVAVEVIGTRFAIERTPEHVRVSVAHGIVRVLGAPVPEGERVLHAGESIEVALDGTTDPVSAPVIPVELEQRPERARAPRAMPSAEPRWRELAQSGQHAEAYTVLSAGGVQSEAESASVRDLLLLADVARLSGHADEAVAPLERLLEQHAADPEAPLAAIILARIERRRGGHARAADLLGRALAMGVPSSLDEEIRGERIIELVRSEDREGCAAEALRYLDLYPTGARAADARACSDAH